MIKNFLERVSVRDFDKNPISEQDLETLKQVINNAPTSTNTQQFSAIIVTDQEIKNFIAEKNWNQKHIAESAAFVVFVGDRTRINHVVGDMELDPQMLMQEFYRSTIDATIGATYAHDALIDMGYGVTFVGGVVGFADELATKLNLPESAFVVVGLSFGKPTRVNDFKPKVNKVFINSYDQKTNAQELEEYNKTLISYYANRGKAGKYDDYFNATRAINNPAGGYAPVFKKAGAYVEEVIKRFKK